MEEIKEFNWNKVLIFLLILNGLLTVYMAIELSLLEYEMDLLKNYLDHFINQSVEIDSSHTGLIKDISYKIMEE